MKTQELKLYKTHSLKHKNNFDNTLNLGCIKLKNVTPVQHVSARKALVTRHHRGERGTVFIEDKSDTGLSINNAKVLVEKSIGTYEDTTVQGSKAIIPHLVIE